MEEEGAEEEVEMDEEKVMENVSTESSDDRGGGNERVSSAT